MRRLSYSNKSSGFTLVEMLIVIVVLAGAGIAIVSAMFNMYNMAISERTKVELGGDLKIALGIIERDVRFSRGFATTLPTGYVDRFGDGTARYGSAGYTWSFTGIETGSSLRRALIVRGNATTKHPLSLNRSLVYQGAPSSSSCNNTAERILKQQHFYFTIYFVRSGNLTKRVITDRSTPVCNASPQYQRATCPREVNIASYSDCQAYDEIIARNVEEFSVQYYATTGDNPPVAQTINTYATTPAPAFVPGAQGVLVKLKIQRTIAGKDVSYAKELRMARMNQ